MDEIAGFRARSVFAPRAPADFADTRQDIGYRLLLSMMMDASTSSGLTSNNRPHNADWMPSCGATAARRTEPGVCAVPGSNPTGLTMRIGGIFCHHVHEWLLVGNDWLPQFEALSPLDAPASLKARCRWSSIFGKV